MLGKSSINQGKMDPGERGMARPGFGHKDRGDLSPPRVSYVAVFVLICLFTLGLARGLSQAMETQQVRATLPNGRLITPVGDWVTVAPFPFALAVRPDGEQIVVPSLGFPFALNTVDKPYAAERKVNQIPPGFHSSNDVQVYTGVAYSPDGKLLYDATGESGAVDIWSPENWKKLGRIDLNRPLRGKNFKQSFASSLTLSPDGRMLYVVDEGNWRIAVVDTTSRTTIASPADRHQSDCS